MVRNIIGFFSAFVVAWCLMSLIQLINVIIVPMPEGFDPSTRSYYREFISQMPAYGHFVIGLSHLVGTVAGGAFIGAIVKDDSKVLPVGLGLLMMLLWTAHIVVIPHPFWLLLIVYVSFVPAAIYGFQAGRVLFHSHLQKMIFPNEPQRR